MKKNAIQFLYAIDCYLLYMLSGVVSAASVVAYYSLNALLTHGGMSGVGTSAEFIDYISEFVSGKSSLVLLVSYIIVLACIAIVFKIRKKRLFSYAGMNHFSFWSVVGSIVSGAVIALLIYRIFPSGETPGVQELSGISLLCILIGPFVEELMFRGVLLKMFGFSCGLPMSVLITSALFAVSHGNLIQALYTFILGIVLGIVRIKSTSLWSACAIHMSFNIAGAVAAVYDPQLSGKGVLLGIVIVLAAMFIACSGGRKTGKA